MDAQTLRARLNSDRPPLLLQVLPAEVFAARRLPGSVNACVYEMAFLSQVEKASADRGREIVVYGAGEGSRDAQTAGEKLVAAGYGQVEVFSGGLAEWEAAGFPLEGTPPVPSAPQPEGVFRVNTAESVVRWTGRNLFNHHNGTVPLAGGELTVRNGRLEAAHFEVDLREIRNEDLTDSKMVAMLIAHLQSDDFFDVANHPVASFSVVEAKAIPEAAAGTPNYLLRGIFTLRGVSHPLEFPIVVAAQSATRITGQAQFELDRTIFGSIYGSGRFFRFLGPHVVNDHIHLHIKIHADAV